MAASASDSLTEPIRLTSQKNGVAADENRQNGRGSAGTDGYVGMRRDATDMVGTDPGPRWGDVQSDAESTADAYEERGWTALAGHPGDVNPVADAARIDVLLPGSEFEAALDAVTDAAIDGVDVYAGAAAGVAYRLVVATAEAAQVALCVPTYLTDDDLSSLRAAAAESGTLTVRLRPLDDRDHVEIAIDEPAIFFDAPEA